MNRIALVLALCATSVAHADSRAWTAAKKVLPSGLDLVAGANAGAVRSSKLFGELWPKLVASNQDVGKTIDLIKSACAIDAQQVIDSAAVGAVGDQVLIVVALKGVVQKDFEACVDKVSRARDGKPMPIAKTGGIVKYGDGSNVAYGKWLSKDTLAFASEPTDKDLLGKLTAGGLGGDKALKTALAAVKTDAAAWAVANKSQDLDQVHAKMSQIYGSADLKGGNIALDVHIVVDGAKAATGAAAQANEQLAQLKSGGKVPPAFETLAKALVIKPAGSDLVITASLAEADMLAIVQAALSMLGH